LDSSNSRNGTGNKIAVNLDCLSDVQARGYTKDLKEKMELHEYPNKTFVEGLVMRTPMDTFGGGAALVKTIEKPALDRFESRLEEQDSKLNEIGDKITRLAKNNDRTVTESSQPGVPGM
jgi:hypothetical protein